MKNINQLIAKITTLTLKIETEFPELYQFLNEEPVTLPVANHPRINTDTLADYLESLSALLKHHLETHTFPTKNKGAN